MTQFTNVTVLKKANIYFDGRVTSRTVLFPDGARKTLGILLPGEYEFGTGDKEVIEITTGEMDILLPGAAAWITVKEGGMFEVPANSKFGLQVETVTDYVCTYIKE